MSDPVTSVVEKRDLLYPVLPTRSENYYFTVNGQEGAAGFTDNVKYESGPFTSFAEAYEALTLFEPYRYWHNLIHMQSMYIWKEGHPQVYVYENGYKINVADLPKLSVTEEVFDTILATLNTGEDTNVEYCIQHPIHQFLLLHLMIKKK